MDGITAGRRSRGIRDPMLKLAARDSVADRVAGVNGAGLTCSAAVGTLAAEWILDGEGRSLSFGRALLPERTSRGRGNA